jgi:hypothetical protein
VTQAIKSAIKKIARQHPALAEHLTATIRTGYRCEYRPDPGRPVAWRLHSAVKSPPGPSPAGAAPDHGSHAPQEASVT